MSLVPNQRLSKNELRALLEKALHNPHMDPQIGDDEPWFPVMEIIRIYGSEKVTLGGSGGTLSISYYVPEP